MSNKPIATGGVAYRNMYIHICMSYTCIYVYMYVSIVSDFSLNDIHYDLLIHTHNA